MNKAEFIDAVADNAELTKADAGIAALYDERLVEPALRPLGLHVLIAEDNPINQTILIRWFRRST